MKKLSILTVALVVLLFASLSAQAQMWSSTALPQFTNSVSNATNTITSATSTNMTYPLAQLGGNGCNVWVATTPANAGTSNCICAFNLISSTGLALTTYPYYTTNTLTSSNVTVTTCLQLTAAQLKNYYGLRFDQCSTSQTNAVTVAITVESYR